MDFVIKIGGSVISNIENIAKDLKNHNKNGNKFVLVHGIGPQVDSMQRALGKEPQWFTSVSGIKCRYTDEETIEIFNRVSSGVNTEIVAELRKHGINAVGLCGSAVNAKRKDRIKVIENDRKRIIEGDYTGKITSIESALLRSLLDNGFIPVIPPLAIGENFEVLNINGDRAAANIARELGISTLVNLSDVNGVLRNEQVIPKVKRSELENLRKEVAGGMTMKLLAVNEALEFGIARVIIASGQIENPVTNALALNGTVFENE